MTAKEFIGQGGEGKRLNSEGIHRAGKGREESDSERVYRAGKGKGRG